MIAQVMGKIASKTDRSLIVDTGGVGYEIFCNKDILYKVKDGQEVKFFTHLNVREDAQELYGFLNQDDLSFFKLMLSVSGIGPRSALNILDVAKPEEIRLAVANQDPGSLHAVHGIGKKTAAKIAVELKDKLELGLAVGPAAEDEAVMEAIINLGYTPSEARQAVRAVKDKEGDLADKVKAALKSLSRA